MIPIMRSSQVIKLFVFLALSIIISALTVPIATLVKVLPLGARYFSNVGPITLAIIDISAGGIFASVMRTSPICGDDGDLPK